MNALRRLLDYNRDFARRCVTACWGRPAFHVGVEQHLINDAVAEDRALRRIVCDTAHAAETYDLQALVKIGEAQHPESDGGRDITPKEMRSIKPLIAKSAVLDHDTSDTAIA